MTSNTQWSLGTKLTLVVAPFLVFVLISTAATLWVSWQLDGGAAAINEAGRMRMQTYRMALSVSLEQTSELTQQIAQFEQSVAVLRMGDPDRPLFVPWDNVVRDKFETVVGHWAGYRDHWLDGSHTQLDALRIETGAFVSDIDALVISIESHMALWTSLLYLLQMSVLGMAILVAAILIYTGYVFVLEPVGQLKLAIEKIQQGDFDSRVNHVSSDEFGMLAMGFNGMADNLQSMYRNLEHKVTEKTSELEEKKERLEGLYEVTTLVANATTLDDLSQGFVKSMARIARADGVMIRWSDQDNQHYLMLAALGMPQSLVDAEQCIDKGSCYCGEIGSEARLRVVPIQGEPENSKLLCAKAGFKTVINVPIRLHERLMGEIDLFFNAIVSPPPAVRSLLEVLGNHLASAMENLRLNALEKEAAVSQERMYLARELHDSIAQSLAFLKIQVQLLRDAVQSENAVEIQGVLEEIDTGVRESYGNVRELLLHFRTRANDEEIEPALSTTLRKFEHQSGVKASMSMRGRGMPLPPDVQIQVLHIVQEALSNVRKHARASHVQLAIEQQPAWRFEVRDDGIGFQVDNDALDETHVGLRIMKERAQRIGAELNVISTPGHGSTVVLTLPAPADPMPDEAPVPKGAMA
ncbi:MAG: type IV pili methyl-accepting chemotaxis transducer N-terminal domain-containing protein [Propionivibrio sp.]|nr:type IV pili methyl-accepting chemotaxis transducer N-terminal domain-containing protein [Propionivibrio sp.]